MEGGNLVGVVIYKNSDVGENIGAALWVEHASF